MPKKTNKEVIINEQDLPKHINQSIKNRKNTILNLKNNTKTSQNAVFIENYVFYKPLNKCKLKSKFNSVLTKNNHTYVELKNHQITKDILSFLPIIEAKINSNKLTYRSINNECIIETVANTYAHSILLKENFNIFDSFKSLTSLVKVYKKEADILSYLVISKLIIIYINLLKDIKQIKKQISKGSKAKYIPRKVNSAYIYAIAAFNKNSSQLILKNNLNIVKATNEVLNELDEIYYKQRIIYNYIKYLSEGIK